MRSFSINTKQFVRDMKLLDSRFLAAAEKGVAKAGMALLRDSVMSVPTVPLDEGTLRGSGSVIVQGENTATAGDLGYPANPDEDGNGSPATSDASSVDRDAIVAVVGFNTPYAARLHEHPEFEFNEPGSGGKYLEQPLADNEDKYKKIVGTEIKKGIRRG